MSKENGIYTSVVTFPRQKKYTICLKRFTNMKMFFPRFSDKKTSWQNRSLGSLAGHERRITKYWDTRHMQRVILKKRIFGFFRISNPHLTPGSGSRYLNVTCTKNTTNKLIWWLINYDQSTNLIYEKCLIFNKTSALIWGEHSESWVKQ